jgi:segregation and condensation protein B
MNKKAKIEAALFVSDKPLNMADIVHIAGGDPQETERLVQEIASDCKKEDKGVELVETPEGYEYRIKQEYRDTVASLAPFSDLSEGLLRTLAIVAAKQPIKQSTLVAYQGNKVYDYVVDLENKGLIKTEKFSRTKILTTTAGFEKYFGKSVEEVKRMLNRKLDEGKDDSTSAALQAPQTPLQVRAAGVEGLLQKVADVEDDLDNEENGVEEENKDKEDGKGKERDKSLKEE